MNQRGLSTTESLTILAVILVVVGLVVSFTNPLEQFKKMHDQKRKSDLHQLQKVLEGYYKDRGAYPQSRDYKIVDFKNNLPVPWGQEWIPYMKLLPIDPSSGSHYVYYTANNNQTYYLYAALEESNDPNRCTSGGPGVCESIQGNSLSANICGGRCNYGLSSPNTAP